MSGPHDEPELSEEELAELSREEQMRIGARTTGFRFLYRRERFAVPGSKAERRAERQVAACFLLTALGAIGFMVVYVAVPWQFELADPDQYRWYTPLLGVFSAIALFGIGFGSVMWAKKLMPEEVVEEERHDGPSPDFDRQTTASTITQGVVDTGLPRRAVVRRALGLGGGMLGVMAIFPLGGLVKKPKGLSETPWDKGVRLIQVDGRPVRPEDMQPGSLATVFPDVPGGLKAADGPVMLIRLRPGSEIKFRKNQEDFGWGDYIAYSKICTHAGCPVSLFEQQTNRLLCPCHQSQFDVLLDGEPIFGPAARPLPSLPITVDGEGFFVARSDFVEPIGPAFWERRNDYNE